ncbi:efflux RND transporter periplasmic adaptor subunit [Pelovirga terrestris]|uniref:Efflux RND transporter periplasmic adaptor subunit n=1 Tax=Pelovirga terrestris TaxID=2771352 RepID=A0A8J6QZC4_9BACT|nr:efflux RND transporter periplasmic adaptor subunit [Pelovirga terrestris]MBD1401202.1 efflux RND transporter periplasmic adaptor subunit [Pelovirga terrestris]
MRIPGSNQHGRFLLPVVIVLLLISAVAGGWYYLATQKDKPALPTFATVQRGSIEDLVTATGVLQPRDYVDVGAQVSGQLHRIHVEVGDQINRGDLLAEIDPTLFMAKVDAGRAQLRYQRALLADRQTQLELARIQHQRQQNLLAAQATTEENAQNTAAAYQSAKAQIEMLMAQIEQNESSLRADEANLSYAQIYAPMDGTVVSISARQGQTINATQQAPVLMQIADLATMTVKTRVSEADISRLQIGMEAYFTTLGGRNQRWYGTLYRIEPTPTVENNVVLYSALFDVDNRDRKLLPQMTAQVFFVIAAAEDTLLLPVSALTDQRPPQSPAPDNGTPATVMVPDQNANPVERRIRVGISNRIQVQILEGLNEGDQVVTSMADGSGQRTNPARPPMGMRMR